MSKPLGCLVFALCSLVAGAAHLSADELSVKISLAIRENSYVPAADRIECPLAFRAQNTGAVVIDKDRVPDLFFKGVIHVSSGDGNERHADVQTAWRTMIYDLRPGETFESPIYTNLLGFFPSLKDGTYRVWWTREKAKSNALRFKVAKGKLSLLAVSRGD